MNETETIPQVQRGQPAANLIISSSATIKNRYGLHARAAAKLVKAAEAFKAELTMAKDESLADVRSLLSLLSLGCACNSQVTLTAAGEDAPAAIKALLAIINDRFGED
ncbi:MAG: HPr family phosphocarrier protein [Deltaproteobacteria bacterium]|jgi:phosphocarrier protein|nr:HPr family phosphocarrier protein [Deltaproteobacteria bacterium]